MTYPELYGVVEGKAHYLLQKRGMNGLEKTVLIEAKEGDIVLIPPGFGHITINPTDKVLKMANWVCSDFDSIYKPIQNKGGAAWFELTNGKFVKNDRYGDIPKLEKYKASKQQLFNSHLYNLIKTPDKLKFLKYPEVEKKIFEKLDYY